MKKNKVTTLYMLKVLLLIFIIGNSLYALCTFLAGDMSSVKGFITETGIMVLLNAVLLILVECLERIERKIWNRKCQVASHGDGSYRLLKCSGGYFMLPIAAILLDIMCGVSLWREQQRDADSLMQILKSEEIVFPICYLTFLNCISVFVILYYCCYKVYYTRHFIGMMHFMRQREFSCAEIKKITYYCQNKRHREKLILETNDKKLVLRSDILSDGWEEFMDYIKNIAMEYDIKINNTHL